jgi:choline-glycine betaine transporter
VQILVIDLALFLGKENEDSVSVVLHGRFKLGDDNEEPEFSFMSWIGMLFSAGLGVGIVFWGVAEPLTHYLHFVRFPNEKRYNP